MPHPPASARHCALRLRPTLSRLSRRLRRAAATQLPSAKLSALALLHGRGALTASQLAAAEGVKPQSLTRLLAELEADGLLQRAPHPSDGRQSLLRLTRAGARVATGEARRREAVLAQAIGAVLSHEEIAIVERACGLLDRLAEQLHPAASVVAAEATP
jgi:DNA-binding MarR family transcriptional regulator